MAKYTLKQQLFAEFIGTASLLCAVIGSGIMAESLSGGNMGLALLANTLATVFALYVLIETLGPVSGAHFNPLVTLVMAWHNYDKNSTQFGVSTAYAAILFIAFQLLGAIAGAWLANAMFDAVATAGLVFVILRSSALGVPAKASSLVACYIGAAYWFTASTSFANPAAVMGRMFSDSFAGIAPESSLAFVIAQIAGSILGYAFAKVLMPAKTTK